MAEKSAFGELSKPLINATPPRRLSSRPIIILDHNQHNDRQVIVTPKAGENEPPSPMRISASQLAATVGGDILAETQDAYTEEDPGLKVPLVGMIGFGFMVGIIAGFGAVGFRLLIGIIHNTLFHGEYWNPFYDANAHTFSKTGVFNLGLGPWAVILVPAVPTPIVAWLVLTFAPEAKGHGVPEVIDAVHYKGGKIRPKVAAVKSLASAISIGSGGSVGREGPIVQIGSAFGSTVGQVFGVRAHYKRILIACGAAGGIGATFNAPIGGILFSIELLLPSITASALMPVGLSACVATTIGRVWLSNVPAFPIPDITRPSQEIENIISLFMYIPMGICIGVASLAFLRGLYWAEDAFESFEKAKYYGQHVVGMFMHGSLFFSLYCIFGHYFVDGVGYSTIVDLLNSNSTDKALYDRGLVSTDFYEGNYTESAPLCFLLSMLKILATWLTIGSGASGGIFSPSLFMGCTFGAGWGNMLNQLFPSVGFSPPRCMVAAMSAMVSGGTGAVMTSIVMVYEMTRDYNSILPIILASVTAYATRKYLSVDSIYSLKLRRRGHIVPEGLQSFIDNSKLVGHVMNKSKDAFRIIQSPSEQVTAFEGVTLVGNGKGQLEYTFLALPQGLLTYLSKAGKKVPTYKEYAETCDADVQTILGTPGAPYLNMLQLLTTAKSMCVIVLAPSADITSEGDNKTKVKDLGSGSYNSDQVSLSDVVGIVTFEDIVKAQSKTAAIM